MFWHMQLYMSWYIRSFFDFTFLNILYFFKYSCTNIFHRRSLYTFYQIHKQGEHIWERCREMFKPRGCILLLLISSKVVPGIHFTSGSLYPDCENMCCPCIKTNDQIKLWFCTCYDSWAVMACTRLWHDRIIIFYNIFHNIMNIWIMSS